jgi:F0F1-type ATP synthase assembly protein I
MPSESNDKPAPETPLAGRKTKNFSQQFAIAIELPFILVGTILVGGAIGYFLDAWLHTMPALMIVFGTLGFVAGLRDILRRLPKD